MVRLSIPIVLITLAVLSDAYIYHRYISHEAVWRWGWWIPMAAVIGFFVKFLFFSRGLAEDYDTTNLFLLLLMGVCVPKMLFALFAPIPRIGTYLGMAMAAATVGIVLWGITWGFAKLRVREVEYESEDVPEAFDGYRIVQFSDAHTGSFRGPYRHLLAESIDSINALKPDLICFTGDIENFSPSELTPHREAFSRLKAADGVFSIMGNHDYSAYIKVSDRERAALVRQTRETQRSFGWRLLENEHCIITRRRPGTAAGSPTTAAERSVETSPQCDSIALIGEENWGKPPFPQYGNLRKATAGLDRSLFTVMLSHDPNAWEAHILPALQPAITLSGHTHGTQFSLFGWSPASLMYKHWGGEYRRNGLMLNVSTGFGGNFPFRFGMPREVVLITLKRKATPPHQP